MSKKLLLSALKISLEAGKKILEIYNTEFTVELKSDYSPLTAADQASHDVIFKGLSQLGFPILSEEGKDVPFDERKNWENYWLVDPLDGTKEFVKRNGEFTVNIAFMQNDSPILGVIYCPVLGFAFGGFDDKVYKIDADSITGLTEENLSLYELSTDNQIPENEKVVIASRSHLSEETEQFISLLNLNGDKISIINAGSALKFCLLAEGKASVYPRFAPTMEWDTAAGHAILKARGMNIWIHPSNVEMKYNKTSLVNDWFIAR